jgi:hypothetical protein
MMKKCATRQKPPSNVEGSSDEHCLSASDPCGRDHVFNGGRDLRPFAGFQAAIRVDPELVGGKSARRRLRLSLRALFSTFPLIAIQSPSPSAQPALASPPASPGSSTNEEVPLDIDITSKRLDEARQEIQPSLRATKYNFDQQALQAIPQLTRPLISSPTETRQTARC